MLLVDGISAGEVNLAMVRLGNDAKLEPLLDLPEVVTEPVLSRDGRWLAYEEAGANTAAQVSVRPFPGVTQQRRLIGPGHHPVFSADGAELYLFDGGGLSVVSVQSSPFRVGTPRPLFRGQYWYGVGGSDGSYGRAWDVDPKSDRFLMITLPPEAPQAAPPPPQVRINVVLNWFEELKQRVPKR